MTALSTRLAGRLKTGAFALLAGLLFGIGLVVSGMSNPAKVLNFLDVAGSWDASLIFVLGGASLTTLLGYRLVWRRARPVLSPAFELPVPSGIDWRLLAGSALFGMGWGIGGFCPGPAWTALPLGANGATVFLGGMLLGMLVIKVMLFYLARNKPATPATGR